MEPLPKYRIDQQRQESEPLLPHPGSTSLENAASITGLADEILLKNIYVHLNPRDVSRMACACKRFYQFATNIWAERGLDTRTNHDWFYGYLLRHPVIRNSENDYRKALSDHLRNATKGKVTQEALDGLFKTITTANEELFSACSAAEMKMLVDSLMDQAFQAAMGRLSVVLQSLHDTATSEDRAHQAFKTAMRRKYPALQGETISPSDTTTSENRAPSGSMSPASTADDSLSKRMRLAAILITCPVLSETRMILSNKLNPNHPMAILRGLRPFSNELKVTKSEKVVDDQLIERLSEALNLSDLQVLVRINASPDFQAIQKKLMEKHQATDMFIRLSASSLITDVVLPPHG